MPTGDRAANLQKAISAFVAALRVFTEKDFPTQWAQTQDNLGNAYAHLLTGDRTANLQKAIAAYDAALGVYTEKDFPIDWARIQYTLGLSYVGIADRDVARVSPPRCSAGVPTRGKAER